MQLDWDHSCSKACWGPWLHEEMPAASMGVL